MQTTRSVADWAEQTADAARTGGQLPVEPKRPRLGPSRQTSRSGTDCGPAARPPKRRQ
ncbi:hypothetical protein ACFO9Q_03440 [Paenibacillus sp. GCM10023252]|uniref:hypothetical protein n=1 Tax=Paenibacillus sp. GCM10023252 TaxID=3252649 RepID=UPI003619023A